MVDACVDGNDQVTQNTLLINKIPAIDGAGRYTLGQIDLVTQEIANSILRDAETNPLNRAVNKYGSKIYDATGYLNGLLRQQIGDLSSYPDLSNRWQRGDISNLETADFMQAYNYTPTNLINDGNAPKLARNLDAYYKNDFNTSILGGFCDAFDKFFLTVDAFFDLIGVVDGIIADALELVNKVQRGYDGIKDLTVQELIKKLIKAIKDKITEVIDKVFQEVQDMINNFDPGALVADAETFVNAKVVKGIMTTREQMCAFFTEENKKGIKDKIKV